MIEYTYRSSPDGTYRIFMLHNGRVESVAIAYTKDNAELIINSLNRCELLDKIEWKECRE